uniref:Protein kinase domain-containing protein n=1 Tax=Brassica oleracea var. oleracea TaxID=109376 RepID=A0A0D3ASW4_BRAOL
MELSVNDVKFTPQEFAELIAAMNVTINGKSGKHVTSFCAVGDAVIMQFVNGTGKHVGIRVDYLTAAWLNTERSNQFIVQAYIKGLDYIDLEASSCPLSQDRLLLPIDRSDKVTCTKLQSFIEELKQLIYFTTHMVIVVITKLTFQIVSTGDGGSSWRPRCHQRLSRLLLLQYHWLQFYWFSLMRKGVLESEFTEEIVRISDDRSHSGRDVGEKVTILEDELMGFAKKGRFGYSVREANISWGKTKWSTLVLQLDHSTWVLESRQEALSNNTSFEYEQTCVTADHNLYQITQEREQRPFSEGKISTFMSQMLQVLAHMHKNSYFHRQLKPKNLLVTSNILKIADFGLACEVASMLPRKCLTSFRYGLEY